MKKACAVLLLLALLCAPFSALAAEWSVTNVSEFGEDAAFTQIKLEGNDGKAYIGFADASGRVACCLPASQMQMLFSIADHYAYIFTKQRDYVILDVAAGRVLASTRGGAYDMILAMGCWAGRMYYAVHADVSGFYGKAHQYTIYDESGASVFQKTVEKKLSSVSYCGEGWFLFHDGSNAEYCCMPTGKTVVISGVSDYVTSVENGITANLSNEKPVLINLNTGESQVFGLLEASHGANAVEIGRVSEGKAVVFEYNSFHNDPVLALYYLAPGKGAVRLSSLDRHVKAPVTSQYQYCRFANGKLLLPLVGADGKSYVAVIDENDRVITEPFLADSMSVYAISDGRIVTRKDGVAQVYDENGKLLFTASDYHEKNIGAFHQGVAPLGKCGLIDRNGGLIFYGSVSMDGAAMLSLE